MQIHSDETIDRLKKSRAQGHSIQELMREFSMAKSTVWHHIHNIKLSKEQANRLKSNQGGSKIRSRNDWDRAEKHAQRLLTGPTKYPCSLLAMLYWADGSQGQFTFTNTSDDMIRLFITILTHEFDVRREHIVITIRIFSNLNLSDAAAIHYWSTSTGLPASNFKVYLNDGGTVGKAPHGICRVAVRRSGYLHKIITSLIKIIPREIMDAQ